jgi:Second Messenger Oligonucleotide or Dinucleotide Synthetase domain
MQLDTFFRDFLRNIRLGQNHINDLKRGHRTLRQRLQGDARLSPIIVSTFLQGSYRRATAIRPRAGKRSDVDVVVVTKLSQDDYPEPGNALEEFIPFLDEHYAGKYTLQGRSIGIELSYVDLDLVITSAPSESEIGLLKAASVTVDEAIEDLPDWRLVKSWVAPEQRGSAGALWLLEKAQKEAEWQLEPLYIPDRDAACWTPTHPIEQIRWTRDKNKRCNGHYVNVVKAIKWWRRIKHTTPKYPKGYPVEHLVGQCCPDEIMSIADGVTRTLETIQRNYALHVAAKLVPDLPDHGVPTHNVFKRITAEDFAAFYEQAVAAAAIARRAYDSDDIGESAEAWRELFGSEFPPPPPDDGDDDDGGSGPAKGGFTPRTEVSQIGGTRFG